MNTPKNKITIEDIIRNLTIKFPHASFKYVIDSRLK